VLSYGYSYKHLARPDRVKPWFEFLTSGHSDAQPWASECPDVKNYKSRLNPVWTHAQDAYSCTHMATVSVKGLNKISSNVQLAMEETSTTRWNVYERRTRNPSEWQAYSRQAVRWHGAKWRQQRFSKQFAVTEYRHLARQCDREFLSNTHTNANVQAFWGFENQKRPTTNIND